MSYSHEAQLEPADVTPTSGDGHFCMENYDTATCGYRVSNPPMNLFSSAPTKVSSHPAGSCSTFVLNTAVIDWDSCVSEGTPDAY